MEIRKITKEEEQRADELFCIAFEMPPEPQQENAENPAPEKIRCNWAAFEEGTKEMMSTFTVTDFSIHFDGHLCKMGGIGGVSTLPQYRRMGGIRGCFEKALPDMYQNGYDFSYLYPFSTGYYRKFGYECCVQKYQTVVQLGLLNPPAMKGTFLLMEKSHPMTDAVRTIDQAYETVYNMMVSHEEPAYYWTKGAAPATEQSFTYVYFDEKHLPKAYTTFRKADEKDGRNLICSKFYFLDQDGFVGLLNLFKSLSADHMYLKFTVPVNTAMQYLLPEWSMGAARWEVLPAGMVRVVSAENVLKKAKYCGTGSLCIALCDKQIAENNQTFCVTFKDGRADTVTAAPERQADISMDISTFSALICGVCDFEEAKKWMSMQVMHPEAEFSKVFYQKPLFLADYF